MYVKLMLISCMHMKMDRMKLLYTECNHLTKPELFWLCSRAFVGLLVLCMSLFRISLCDLLRFRTACHGYLLNYITMAAMLDSRQKLAVFGREQRSFFKENFNLATDEMV